MNLTRKRKKELRQLQQTANQLWETQQHLLNDASGVAREAGRQLGNYGREQVLPTVQHGIDTYVAPTVGRGLDLSRAFVNDRVIPAVGGVVGSALSVVDAANATRAQLAARRFGAPIAAPAPAKRGMGAGGVGSFAGVAQRQRLGVLEALNQRAPGLQRACAVHPVCGQGRGHEQQHRQDGERDHQFDEREAAHVHHVPRMGQLLAALRALLWSSVSVQVHPLSRAVAVRV